MSALLPDWSPTAHAKWTPWRTATLPSVVGMNAATTRGALLAALACLLVGGSFTANSLLGDYPYAGGQFLRYGLAFLLLVPLAGPEIGRAHV